jgi:hypothetical protein
MMFRRLRYFICCTVLSSCVYHDISPGSPPVEPVCDPATISWQNDILPIMTTACATSGCHNGVSRRDWRDYNEVKQYADVIKRKTQDRSMPFDAPLPQHQIDLIACWVDGGALNN